MFGNLGIYITLLVSILLIFCSLQGVFAIDVMTDDSDGIYGTMNSADSGDITILNNGDEDYVDLFITKEVDKDNAYDGDSLTYTITVYNNGNIDATNVTVTDALNQRLDYTGSSGAEYVSNTGNTYIWNLGTISPNTNKSFEIYVTINCQNFYNTNTYTEESLNIRWWFATPYDPIYNWATAISDEIDEEVGSGAAGTRVNKYVNLSIIKEVNASAAIVGDYLTYKFTITNSGLDDSGGVYFEDILDPRLYYIGCSLNDESDEYVFDYYEGELHLYIYNLLAKNSFTFEIYLKIVEGNIDDIIYNNATILRIENEEVKDSNTVNTTIKGAVNLTLSKTANATTVFVGDTLQYTITVSNYGSATARDVKVIEILPKELVYLSHSNEKGTFTPNTGYWNVCNLAIGETAILYVNVRVNAAGNITNRITVESFDINIGENKEESLILMDVKESISDNTNSNTINEGNETLEAEVPEEDGVKKADDIDDAPNNDANTNNGDFNNSKGISMKNTGIPIIVLLMVLLSSLGITIRKK